MTKIRLSPFVSVIPVGARVVLRSDLRSFALSGKSVEEFFHRALPLLDGSYDAAAIVDAFPDFGEKSIQSLLAELDRLGVIETAEHFPSSSHDMSQEAFTDFLRHWGPDWQRMTSALGRAHVAIIGWTECSILACEGLVRAGVGRLSVLDVLGRKRRRNPGVMTPARLLTRLRRFGSPTVLAHESARMENGALDLPFDDVSLLLVTANADELQLLDAIARMAEKKRLRYMIAHLDGLRAILGPVVIPGETACWECLRERSLANQPNFAESSILQNGLMSGKAATRQSLAPPGAASLLSGLISMEAIKLASDYAPSQLVGRQLEFNLVTYVAKIRGVVRLPWCPICGGAFGPVRGGSRVDSHGQSTPQDQGHDLSAHREPAELRETLAGWVDDRTGIVNNLVINFSSPEQPQSLTTATAMVAGPAVPGHGHAEPLIGSGKSTGKIAAMIGAVGEAIERYSASVYRESDLLRASARKLSQSAFDPVSLCLYLPEQYRQPGFVYDRFDPAMEISWTEAEWLDSGKKVLVPALPTYFNYRARHGEQFCQVTSNGLAAGANFQDAALRATMELIERDAFMMTWLQRRPPQRLDVREALEPAILDLLTEMRDLGMDTEMYLLHGDVKIPCVMCVAWGDGRTRPSATVALAAHFDPVEAVRKAILEQAHVGPYLARLMADPAQKIPRAADDVRTLIDHALFYVPRSRLRSFDFIRSKHDRSVSLTRMQQPSLSGANTCIAALSEAGFRVAVADVTSPDVRLGPFRVARALGTYLQPIDFGYRQRRLANPRLSSPGCGINPDPHPLA